MAHTSSNRSLFAIVPVALLCGSASLAAAQPETGGGAPAPEEGAPAAPDADAAPAEGVMPPPPDEMPVPPPAPEVTPPPELAGYKKGFFIKSADDKYSLTTQARVQARFEGASVDTGDGRDQVGAFSIARARVTLSGHVHTKRLTYKMQSDFGKGFVSLKDWIVDYELSPGSVWFRAGQWKRPYSRQQITSSGSLEFVDRAITDKAFQGSRDIGLAIHNNYEKSPDLEWIVGVFNGTGEKPVFSGDVTVDPTTGEGEVSGGAFSNVPTAFFPAFVARVGLNRGGIKGYSEADLEGGPLRWSAAASVLVQGDFDDDDVWGTRGDVDFIVKSNGFSTTGGFYTATGPNAEGDPELNLIGFHAQAGYMVTPVYQVVGRYAAVLAQGDSSAADQHEIQAGFSAYPYGHEFKIQVDVGAYKNGDAGPADDIRGRAQLQLAF